MFGYNSVKGQNDINVKICGTVKGEDLRVLPNATLYFEELNRGVMCDSLGAYSISLPSGLYHVRVSYVGYRAKVFYINVKPFYLNQMFGIFNFVLDDINVLEDVLVYHKLYGGVSDVFLGVDKLSNSEIADIPSLFGEVDILKAIQKLPGVIPTSEGGSGFSVRGGSPDQNLIILDDALIYNASHLIGFLSVFNNDILEGIKLYKGNFPLKYGGRLSSLLDIRTKNSHKDSISGVGGIGLLTSRLTLSGPLGKKTSWYVGGRRSYADLFLKFSNKDELDDSSLYFYDFNVKMISSIDSCNELEFSAYAGKDFINASSQSFEYGNKMISATWTHIFDSKLKSMFNFNISSYNYFLESELKSYEMSWKSSIRDYALSYDMEYDFTPTFKFKYGISSKLHRFKPGLIVTPDYSDFKLDNKKSIEATIYFSNSIRLFNKVNFLYGCRFTAFGNMGKSVVYNYNDDYHVVDSTSYSSGRIYNNYKALEPRFSVVYSPSSLMSLKLGFVRNVQFIQLANNSSSGSPLDLWFPVSPNIKPQKLNMYSAGYFLESKNGVFNYSVETYFKRMNNVIDYADHAQLLLNKYLEGEIRTGVGRAYGIEFMVKKSKGALSGFINYTYSRSERKIKEINNNEYYSAPYEKRNVINVLLNYRLSDKHRFSTSWVYMSGCPTTYPVGRFMVRDEYFPIYSDRNADRMPAYHRLDVSWTYVPNPNSKKRFRGEWNFSIYNVYGKKNPWMINFKSEHSGTPYAEMTYLFSMLPSISYVFVF